MAKLKHYIIRNVNYEANRPYAAKLKTLCDKIGRRTILNRRNDTRRIARASERILHDNRNFRLDRRFALDEVDGGSFAFAAKNSGKLTSKPLYTKRIRAIPRHFNLKDSLGLLERKDIAQKRTRLRLGGKLHDAFVIAARQKKLRGTAAHSERLHATKLSFLDLEAAIGNDRADF